MWKKIRNNVFQYFTLQILYILHTQIYNLFHIKCLCKTLADQFNVCIYESMCMYVSTVGIIIFFGNPELKRYVYWATQPNLT